MEDKKSVFAWTAEICNKIDPGQADNLVNILERAFYAGNNIFIFGNGGSAATASHFCEDLGKGTLDSIHDKHRFRVMSLTDNSPYILAWANDEGYETVFEQQLRNFAETGDVVIGISGSGNSPNVLRAIEYANKKNMITVGITGFGGGKLKKIVKINVHIPVNDMGIAECLHLIVVHHVVYELKNKICSNGSFKIKKKELEEEFSKPITVVDINFKYGQKSK